MSCGILVCRRQEFTISNILEVKEGCVKPARLDGTRRDLRNRHGPPANAALSGRNEEKSTVCLNTLIGLRRSTFFAYAPSTSKAMGTSHEDQASKRNKKTALVPPTEPALKTKYRAAFIFPITPASVYCSVRIKSTKCRKK